MSLMLFLDYLLTHQREPISPEIDTARMVPEEREAR